MDVRITSFLLMPKIMKWEIFVSLTDNYTDKNRSSILKIKQLKSLVNCKVGYQQYLQTWVFAKIATAVTRLAY